MDKRILVTGATGFVGRHVVTELISRGYHVIATSRDKDIAKRMVWYDNVTYIPFNFDDFDPAVNYLQFFQYPDAVIHLAWEGLPNYKESFHIEINLPRHFALLTNLISNGIRNVTVTGTCFEYGLQEGCLSEWQPSLPENAYAIAKDQLRQRLESFASQFPLVFKWVRLFYLYGEGQSPKSLLSQLQNAVSKGEETFNMSPGDQLRDYLPIQTAASYLVQIAVQNEISGIINCCSGAPVSVVTLVKEYLRNNKADIKLNLGYYPYSDIEPKNFWGDTKKLKTIINNE